MQTVHLFIDFKNLLFPEKEFSVHQFLHNHIKHSFGVAFCQFFLSSRHIIQEHEIINYCTDSEHHCGFSTSLKKEKNPVS